MNFLKHLSIRKKILLIPLVGSIGFFAYLVISVVLLKGTTDLLNDAQSRQFPLLQIAQANMGRVANIQESLSFAVTSGELEALSAAEALVEQFRADIARSREIDSGLNQKLSEILVVFDDYYRQARGISEGMISGNIDFSLLGARSERMAASLAELEQRLQDFYDSRLDQFNSAFSHANESSERLGVLGITLCILTLVILFVVGISISGMIKSSLDQVLITLKNIAEDNGDLTVRIQSRSSDEVGELVLWFNTFMDKLQSVIQKIVETAPPLANLATDVNELSGGMSATLKHQNTSVGDSKNNIELMSQSIASIAQNAGEAAHAARIADAEAKKGQVVVSNTVAGIMHLSDSIKEASGVIARLEQDVTSVNVVLKVIRSIAEQTNLLALNAAIEAARAGEQGRGFAVVADEVRSLASRTQESTEEINTILSQLQHAYQAVVQTMKSSSEAVEGSVTEANQAGQSLSVITDTVKTISLMNEQIAAATEEQQSISSELVGEAERILDQTAHTSSSAGKLNDVSEQLNSLALNLEQITRQFRV